MNEVLLMTTRLLITCQSDVVTTAHKNEILSLLILLLYFLQYPW